MTSRRAPERRFLLYLIATKPEREAIHGLRALLKALLRRFGFRCVDLRETENNTATALPPKRDDLDDEF
jgi:hypothetical protein